MKNKFLPVLSLLALMMTACGGNVPSNNPGTGGGVNGNDPSDISTVSVTGVSLDAVSASIKVNETKSLVATVAPSNATNKNVSWTTSNSSIATVLNGVITAISEGECDITVTTTDGGFTSVCHVVVTGNNDNQDNDNKEDNDSDQIKAELKIGEVTTTLTSMIVNEGDPFVAQYTATLDVTKDSEVQILINDEAVVSGASGEGNNLVFADNKLTVHNDATEATIYVKAYADGGYDTWLTGYVADEINEGEQGGEKDEVNLKTYYLKPGPWNQDNAVFYVWAFGPGSTGEWVETEMVDSITWKFDLDLNKINKIDLVRMAPEGNGDPSWDHKWNQTSDIELTDVLQNLFTITGWEASDFTLDFHA